MSSGWQRLPLADWSETRETLHAHSQVLGKLAVVLAPPEPQLQHGALRLSARGLETLPLPAPDGSGSLVVAVSRLGGEVTIDPTPQEVTWSVPLDEDDQHRRYDPDQVAAYFRAATQAALALAAYRAPYRGRSTPVNAWWGSFDLAVSLYSGQQAEPPATDFITRNSMDAQEVAVGWWPGDARYPKAAFYAYAHPAPDGISDAVLDPPAARWDAILGEFVLDWDAVVEAEDPHATAV